MSNNRVYFATQAAGIAPESTTTYTTVHGLQSIGITTTFNLEQVFEIGQIAIYENIEAVPDIEVTMEKVLDGYPLIYHLATRGSPTSTLAGRSTTKCQVALSVYGDTQDSASGTPQKQVEMSGMYVSSLTYTFPVDGNCTESVTLVGNDKVWITTPNFVPTEFGSDTPLALAGASGGVQRRENVKFGSFVDESVTLLPTDIDGISSSGTNDLISGVHNAHVQTITVSTDLGREELNELGKRTPYFRYVNFPVEVTCEIETTASQGDLVNASGETVNLSAQKIVIVTDDSTKLHLGTQNKLANVTYGGADAGGGNATTTYSYTTFNDLTITHDQDPG